ncbi:MAG: hypothetical protein JO264_01290 [Acidisphaera sp.]|nr:hypothetical protein [Acidisphaera sp.]
MPLKIVAPAANAVFQIATAPSWPAIPFRTDGSGAHAWQWRISWGNFSRSGNATTTGNQWDAGPVVTNLGGALTVTAKASAGVSAPLTVRISGANPSAQEVTNHLNTRPNSNGFDAILQHETQKRHFGNNGEPIKSFDNGFGMAQLTNPVPSYEQVWNWKSNVEGGLSLFAQKVAAARAYLTQSGRSFTDSQLQYEAVSRWNGGSYHAWDDKAQAWVRNPNVLCDTATGNIGWEMTDPANQGKTEAQLHARDGASYHGSPSAGTHWRYFGVCYADRVLG